jgi:hypothetical protein
VRFHEAEPGEPNLYTYVNQRPWSAFDAEGLDVVLLNHKEAAAGYGHSATLVGNDKTGWVYYSKNGGSGTSGNQRTQYATYADFMKSNDSKRYDRKDRVTTTEDQDKAMEAYGDANYNKPYSVGASPEMEGSGRGAHPAGTGNASENCADLAAGVMNAGGVHAGTPKSSSMFISGSFFTDPDKQFDGFQKEHDKPAAKPPSKPASDQDPNSAH